MRCRQYVFKTYTFELLKLTKDGWFKEGSTQFEVVVDVSKLSPLTLLLESEKIPTTIRNIFFIDIFLFVWRFLISKFQKTFGTYYIFIIILESLTNKYIIVYYSWLNFTSVGFSVNFDGKHFHNHICHKISISVHLTI